MDDLDFDKCPPQSVSDSLWRPALAPLSLAVITPPLVHCLVSRALPSGSLRAEHRQSLQRCQVQMGTVVLLIWELLAA